MGPLIISVRQITPLVLHSRLLAIAAMSFALAVALTPLLRMLALTWGVVSRPDERHPQGTPSLGGPAIIGSFLISLWALGYLANSTLLGSLLMCSLGVLDDVIELRPKQKLVGEIIIIAVVLVLSGRFSFVAWGWLDVAISGAWLLAMTNAFNLIDGLDGLAAGIGVLASAAIATASVAHGHFLLAEEGIGLAAALSAFLFFNFQPAVIFMGDSGALSIGMTLGILSLKATQAGTSSDIGAWAFPIVAMMVPLMDTGIVILSRLGTGRPVSRRSRDHLHDKLLALGISERAVILMCWSASAFAGIAAVGLSLLPLGTAIAALPFVALPFLVAGLFLVDMTFDAFSPGSAYPELRGLAKVVLKSAYQWRLGDVVLDLFLISAAYLGAFLMRLEFNIPDNRISEILIGLPWVIVLTYLAMWASGVYRVMWQYTRFSDFARFASGSILASTAVLIASRILPIAVSGSILVIFPLLMLDLLIATRMSFIYLRRAIRGLAQSSYRILIVGAGHLGVSAADMLVSQRRSHSSVVGFADDDLFKRGKLIGGRPVLGALDDLDAILRQTSFNRLVVAARSLETTRRSILESFARQHGIEIEDFRYGLRDTNQPMPSDLALNDTSTQLTNAAGR